MQTGWLVCRTPLVCAQAEPRPSGTCQFNTPSCSHVHLSVLGLLQCFSEAQHKLEEQHLIFRLGLLYFTLNLTALDCELFSPQSPHFCYFYQFIFMSFTISFFHLQFLSCFPFVLLTTISPPPRRPSVTCSSLCFVTLLTFVLHIMISATISTLLSHDHHHLHSHCLFVHDIVNLSLASTYRCPYLQSLLRQPPPALPQQYKSHSISSSL